MGGCGSGQWYRSSKRPTVEDGLVLGMDRLFRFKHLAPFAKTLGSISWVSTGSGERTSSIDYEADLRDAQDSLMRLQYSKDGTPRNYTVRLTTTRPNFGGLRWWFVCPVTGTRAAKLYLPHGGDIFASRKAYGLAYTSQNEDLADRQLSKAQKIRRSLGGDWGLDAPFPEKPKGMHWKTYYRQIDQAIRYEETGWAAAMTRFGMIF